MDFGAALMGLLIAFVVKVTVMVLAVRLLLRLYRVAANGAPKKPWLLIPAEERHRFRALVWGLLFFCVSELVCGIEIYILTRSSLFLESFHSVTSAVAMALTTVGLFQLLDWKYVHLVDTQSSCIAVKTCKVCTKRTGGRCQYRTAMLLTSSLLLLMAAPALFASTARLDADPKPYVLPFESWNRWYDETAVPWLNDHLPNVVTDGSAFYLHEGMFLVEFRILPIAAMILAAFGIAAILASREDRGILLLLICFGVLAYVYFEIAIYGVTRDAYFGSLAHEVGEFFFLLIVAEVLTRVFQTEPRRAAAA